MTWEVGPTVLTSQLTGPWHGMPTVHADIIPDMPTVHNDVTVTSWWCHPYPSQPNGLGQLAFGSGQFIRVKKTRVCALDQPPRWSVMARAAVFDFRFRRAFQQWLHLLLLYTMVCTKHNFNNFHFLAKIKHHFKPNALIPIVGDSGSPMRGPVVYW